MAFEVRLSKAARTGLFDIPIEETDSFEDAFNRNKNRKGFEYDTYTGIP